MDLRESTKRLNLYTIVQHSGFGYADDDQFEHGLEERSVSPLEERRVKRVGGLIFPNYKEASDFCQEEMYDKGVEDLIPHAPGNFSNMTVDRLRIYIPKIPKQEEEELFLLIIMVDNQPGTITKFEGTEKQAKELAEHLADVYAIDEIEIHNVDKLPTTSEAIKQISN